MVSGHYGSSRHYRTNAKFVRQRLEGDGSGHDWWHIERVRNMAVTLGREENADLFIVELGALLHDIADWKFHDDLEGSARSARVAGVVKRRTERAVDHVHEIVRDISFKGAGVKTDMRTLEGRIVQDADRLDAMGAIGIARASPTAVTKPRHARSKSKTRAS